MNECENPNELPQKDAHYEVISSPGNSHQNDPYTYYAGTPSTPSEYRYVPKPKKKTIIHVSAMGRYFPLNFPLQG